MGKCYPAVQLKV